MKKPYLCVVLSIAAAWAAVAADFGTWRSGEGRVSPNTTTMSCVGESIWLMAPANSSIVYARHPGAVQFGEVGRTPGRYEALFFQNARTGFMAGREGRIARSVDAGASWTPLASPVKKDLYDLVFVGKSGWAVGDDNAILSTADNGRMWTAQRTGTQARYDFRAVAFLNEKIGWAAGYRYRGSDLLSVILQTRDGGLTWKNQTENIVGGRNFIPCDMTVTDAGWVYIVGQRGAYLMTTDEGEKWTRKDFPFGKGVNILAISFGGARVGCVVGTNGVMWMTDDAGLHWQPVADRPLQISANSSIRDVRMLSPTLGYALGDGFVMKYTSD